MARLTDSTLREGAQACGVAFSLADRKRLASLLAAVGVDELEVGIATPLDADLPALLRHCRRLQERFSSQIALWCRCRKEDILHAAALEPDLLALSIPGSDRHLEQRLGRSRQWALATVARAAEIALRHGVSRLALGIEDASRADIGFVLALVEAAQACGFCRVRLADTVGIWSPAAVTRAVRMACASAPGLEVALHTHNDFGMATANAIAGLEAGAARVDVTALGLGERAGAARLEEVAAWLEVTGRGPGYRLDLLPALSRLAAKIARRPLDPYRPVIGARIFACDTGLHLHGLQRSPELYEPFAPERLGRRRMFFYGAKVGRRALAGKLRELGCQVSDRDLIRLTQEVRRRSANLGRPLADAELLRLAQG